MSKDIIIDRTSQAVTYIGSGGALVGGLTANDVAAIGGLIIAMVALAINIWFKHQHLKLAREAIESGRAQIVIDGDAEDG